MVGAQRSRSGCGLVVWWSELGGAARDVVDVVWWLELGGAARDMVDVVWWLTWSARLMAQALAWWLDAVIRVRRVRVVVGQA